MSTDDEITNRKVIDLYFNERKNIREVCKILGKSSRYVVALIKEHRMRLAPNIHNNKEEVKDLPEVSAYKLFAEGKSPAEAVTKLNLPGPTVHQYYTQYWELENMHELFVIYNEIKDSIGYFLRLTKLAKKKHLTPEEIIGLAIMSNDIGGLKRQHEQDSKNLVQLQSILFAGNEELKALKNKIAAASELLERRLDTIERKSEIHSQLIMQMQKLKHYIEDFKNSQDYEAIEKIVADKVAELLSDNKELLDYALKSVVIALRNDSDRRILFEILQDSFFSYPSVIDNESYWESKRPLGEQFVKERTIEDANRILEQLKRGIVDTTIAKAAGLDKDKSSKGLALPHYKPGSNSP